jgi:uncharacterized protein (DUF1330 family)
MRSYCSLALAILAGIVLGSVGTERLPAQSAGPKAYVIVDITQINDPETFKTLLPKASRPVAEFGGQFLTRTDKITALDGVAPERFVIIGFDSLQKAKDWNDSAGQKEVNDIRKKSTKSGSFVVVAEGM